MKLQELLDLLKEHELLLQTQALDGITELSGQIRIDSREIIPGDIFVCVKGLQADGHAYIPAARKLGAALVICEDDFSDALPAIQVRESRKATALLAKLHYGNPSEAFRLVGVTGTNGKTTTSLLIFQALRELGLPAGWIGTLGYQINEEKFSTRHTTPDSLELNAIFAEMASRGVKYAVMEVSSHALALDRVYGIGFDYCLFTNLTREHLDFHQNMEDYGEAKLRLFAPAVAGQAVAVINTEDSFGKHTFDEIKAAGGFAFSVGGEGADYVIRDGAVPQTASWEQSRFALQTPEGVINLRSQLTGNFNVANLALSAATLSVMGFEIRQIEQGLNAAKPVPGRFERVANDRGIGVFVDYAHTPDALENVLKASRQLQHRRILCLFGAGGDRDQGKRPLMLKTALKYSDAVIVSDDNPRMENPDRIIRDIVTGSELLLPWWIIRDRKRAIEAILGLAQPGDIVLLCGKGHETYQEIAGQRHHFDDAEVAREFLASPQPKWRDDELSLPVDKLMLELLYNVPGTDSAGYTPPQSYRRVSTDSRTIQPESVFFALRGPSFDGHAFVGGITSDPTCLAVGQTPLADNPSYLEVPDSLAAMALLFRKYLLMFGVYKIALTGSTGKSSTKELLAHILETEAPTLKTAANENNLIGLCQTLRRIRPEHRYAVLELGTNAFGEIAALADVCSPDAAMILNVGPSHLEFLIDEEGVFREKTALFDRSLETRLFDADDPRFEVYRSTGKGVGLSPSADFQISEVRCSSFDCEFRLNGEPYGLPYAMPFYVKNGSFAIAMSQLAGIPSAQIRKALETPVRLDLRMEIEILEYCILLADCYNANPVSLQSAIEYWHSLAPDQYHVAILGDMLELGNTAADYHDMIAAILAETGCDLLITVGMLSARYHGQGADLAGKHFATVEDLISHNAAELIPHGAVILVKGSHSIHLEKALPVIRNRC